jgi:hypothetical protein
MSGPGILHTCKTCADAIIGTSSTGTGTGTGGGVVQRCRSGTFGSPYAPSLWQSFASVPIM